MSKLPKEVRGDTPCADCGTSDNPVWFTDNVFWNDVMGEGKGLILCVNCFIIRVEGKYTPTGWKLIPEWHWQERNK